MTFLARIPVAEASLIEAHWKSTIESRVSANHFDPSHVLSDAEIGELVRLATLAPSAYNLQNWRFIAVPSPSSSAAHWRGASISAQGCVCRSRRV